MKESFSRELIEQVSTQVVIKLREQLRNSDNVFPEYLTPGQASKLTGFSVRALESMRCKRIGPVYRKIGAAKNSAIRYHIEDIHAWMQQHREVTDVVR